MIPVLSKTSAQKLDANCIESKYISERKLMDNAGKSIAEFILEYISRPFEKKVLVVAGMGNNGGDGIIAHYYLLKFGINSTLLLSDETIKANWVFNDYQIPQNTICDYARNFEFEKFSIVLDGLFGIGLSRDIEGKYVDCIRAINNIEFVISIDIPSGIDCDMGNIKGIAVSSDVTLTMGYPKVGHLLNKGKIYSGELFVLDIGFNDELANLSISLVTDTYVTKSLQPIEFYAHKYSRGKLALFSGSEGFSGASILASKACLRTGTGIAKLIIPSKINSIIENTIPEIISVPVEGEYGYIVDADNKLINDTISWADCLLVGPGLSTETNAVKCVNEVLLKFNGKLVLDASGFQPIIENLINISSLPKKTILTPHIGEFCKLFNIKKEDVQNDPISTVKSIINQLDGRVLILKGNSSIIVSSKGEISIVSHGNSLLATAGTGDVLSGMISSFVSQGYSLDQSAILGSYLHADISNMYSENESEFGLIASDLIDLIPKVIGSYLNEY